MNWKEYESFVQRLQQAMIHSEPYLQQKNITVEKNKKIIDNAGIEREFDLYWKYELAGITYETVIECKHYSSTIQVGLIDAFVGKLSDLPQLIPVYATTMGYQSGAEIKAKQHNIELLVVREQSDADWVAHDGIPLIKQVGIQVHVISPPIITSFMPMIDKEWAECEFPDGFPENSQLIGLNNEMFLQNEHSNMSLLELASTLKPLDSREYGDYEDTVMFDGWLLHKKEALKLKAYRINYSVPKSHAIEMLIDFSKELDGVIEYINRGIKKTVLKRGGIKEEKLPN
ncbi:restriction endonuclease [Vibrio sp. 10N.222.52.C12]|uniref:restriction endonuclease n=1 Tax=Vibrio sp. 10N.222.52.C12 TaxID=3229630 RepID=UPI0035503EF0